MDGRTPRAQVLVRLQPRAGGVDVAALKAALGLA